MTLMDGGHKTNQVLQLLLQHGYDPDPLNVRGETPLWRFANDQRLTLVMVLLLYGADPDTRPKKKPPLLAYLLSRPKHFSAFVRGQIECHLICLYSVLDRIVQQFRCSLRQAQI